jgi:shikimate dehydrogenase
VVDDFKAPVDASTRVCAVYGKPIRHSASPAMQNAALAALGLNWRYLAFEVDPSHLREALLGAKRMNFIGVNLTVPHKLMAVDWVDALDASARLLGAVNTIRFEGQDPKGDWQPLRAFVDELPNEVRSHGFNTDADAIVAALREDLMLECAGAKVLLLGVGGAGQVTALKLAAEKVAALYLVNRTASKAESLAARLRREFPKVKVCVGYPEQAVDLVINATSLGLLAHDELPFDPRQFSLERTRAVYDMIYRPATTPFLRVAQAAGCRAANGLGMLLHQGAKALEIWTGNTAPLKIMREALEKDVYGGTNDGR